MDNMDLNVWCMRKDVKLNHSPLYIGIIIFPHTDNTQFTDNNQF